MDLPIYSPPSEFNDTILSENIRYSHHEEKTVKIEQKLHDTGAYPKHTFFNSLAIVNESHTYIHIFASNREVAEREKS